MHAEFNTRPLIDRTDLKTTGQVTQWILRLHPALAEATAARTGQPTAFIGLSANEKLLNRLKHILFGLSRPHPANPDISHEFCTQTSKSCRLPTACLRAMFRHMLDSAQAGIAPPLLREKPTTNRTTCQRAAGLVSDDSAGLSHNGGICHNGFCSAGAAIG